MLISLFNYFRYTNELKMEDKSYFRIDLSICIQVKKNMKDILLKIYYLKKKIPIHNNKKNTIHSNIIIVKCYNHNVHIHVRKVQHKSPGFLII